MATTWNGNYVPSEGDLYKFVEDFRKHALQNNRVIPVYTLAERDGLAALHPDGIIPDGTVVLRMDQGGVFDVRVDGGWNLGHQPYRHFMHAASEVVPNAVYTNMTQFNVGPGDQGDETGLRYLNGTVTVERGGLYDINGTVGYLGGIDFDKFAALYADGTRYRSKVNGGTGTIHVSRQLYLNAGSTVTLQAYQNTGADMTIPADADQTYWTIRRISN